MCTFPPTPTLHCFVSSVVSFAWCCPGVAWCCPALEVGGQQQQLVWAATQTTFPSSPVSPSSPPGSHCRSAINTLQAHYKPQDYRCVRSIQVMGAADGFRLGLAGDCVASGLVGLGLTALLLQILLTNCPTTATTLQPMDTTK